MKFRKFVTASALVLGALLGLAAPGRALTVENVSELVLYCSVYRQGYSMPLTQFVLLPGKQHSWSPSISSEIPLVVRAMAEHRPNRRFTPTSCTVHNHLATVIADHAKDGLTLDVRAPQTMR